MMHEPSSPSHAAEDSESARRDLSQFIRSRARALGFADVGICPAVAALGWERFNAWLDAGYDGEMHYVRNRREAYRDPGSILPGARSVVMLALNYRTQPPAPCPPGYGKIASYAWGAADYHDVIRARLHVLADDIRRQRPETGVRGVVDTAPLLEREFARLAGLGWIGKNTLLLHRELGSWFFLAALLLDVELDYDAPFESDHCGSCRACLDACPTQAFPQPYVLDATRCISYLTIELKGPVPRSQRAELDHWLFGCDVCQEVCPWNRRVPATEESVFQPRSETNPVNLSALFEWDDAQFRRVFRATPLWRAKRRGLLRTAALLLGQQRDPAFLPVLAKGLADVEPLVRGACAWALGRIGGPDAAQWLRARLSEENHADVVDEIREALRQCES